MSRRSQDELAQRPDAELSAEFSSSTQGNLHAPAKSTSSSADRQTKVLALRRHFETHPECSNVEIYEAVWKIRPETVSESQKDQIHDLIRDFRVRFGSKSIVTGKESYTYVAANVIVAVRKPESSAESEPERTPAQWLDTNALCDLIYSANRNRRRILLIGSNPLEFLLRNRNAFLNALHGRHFWLVAGTDVSVAHALVDLMVACADKEKHRQNVAERLRIFISPNSILANHLILENEQLRYDLDAKCQRGMLYDSGSAVEDFLRTFLEEYNAQAHGPVVRDQASQRIPGVMPFEQRFKIAGWRHPADILDLFVDAWIRPAAS